jgi:hypothetical protein
MNGLALASRLLLAIAPGLAPPDYPDQALIAGGGFAGKWDTEIEMSNVSPDPIGVVLSIEGLPLAAPCPPNCTSKLYELPGKGAIRVLASDFIGAAYPGPQIIRVQTASGAPLPVVHARAIKASSECQFAELPVIRRSSLGALAVPVLVFPGASRSAGVYSNLILQAVGGTSASVEVELLGPAGDSLGIQTLAVPGDVTRAAFTLVDVAAQFGVSELDGGQVRVRTVAGSGTVWGVLTTVSESGSLQVAVGANP